jgi:putative hemolysin
LGEIMHPPVVVPLTKKVDEMFDFFRANGVRAAACLNEFGGVEGFITIYDVLTFIFGDISGETRGRSLYQERDLNIYELPGEMKLTDANNLTHFGLEDPRMTTIGGVAFRHLDRLPHVGDRVVVDDVALTVLEMDAHRISRVRVAKVSAEEDFEELTEEQQLELTQDLEFVDHDLVSSDSDPESETMADEQQVIESLGVAVNSSEKNHQVG